MVASRFDMLEDRKLDLTQLLRVCGWLVDFPTLGETQQAIGDYQEWWGLKQDGWAGPITARHLEQPRFCGLSDRADMVADVSASLPKFKDVEIGWTIRTYPPGVDRTAREGIREAFIKAWSHWEAVCGIEPFEAMVEGQGVVQADFRGIDRRGGTLAWSELAPLRGRPFLEQRYDILEPWYIGDGNPGPSQIDLVAVACHEIGHALGIGHIRGRTGDLMNPIYDPAIRTPQEGDKREGLARYGPHKQPPTPDIDLRPVSLHIEGVGEFTGKLRQIT